MKNQLYIYIILITVFIIYNQFFAVEDERINTLINILFTSFLVLYMGYAAFILLKKMKKNSKN